MFFQFRLVSKLKFVYSFNIYIVNFKCRNLHTFIRHMENHIYIFLLLVNNNLLIFNHSVIVQSSSVIMFFVLLLSSVVSLKTFKEVDNVMSSAYITKLNN